MCYLAIVSEVDVVSFFDYNPDVWNKVPGFRDGFSKLLGEVKDFAIRMKDADVQVRRLSAGVFKARFKIGSKVVWLLINATSEPQTDLGPYEIGEF